MLVLQPIRAELPAVSCDGRSVCRESGTQLPLRVLPRSFSNLYGDPDFKQAIQMNVPAFQPLYVFSREVRGEGDAVQGRYGVALAENGPAVGWMRAQDVLEWRQALTAAFTHPGRGEEERQRVLMFRRVEDLEAMLASEDVESLAARIYQRIDSGDIPPEVLSKEPQSFVDINRTFYLLPIVDARLRDLYGDEVRLVKLASALPGERATVQQQDVLSNADYRQRQQRVARPAEQLRSIGVDLVFCIDMTLSMQPYIDRAREALKTVVQGVVAAGLQGRFRFGLVGYRDDVRVAPAMEFVARNFTPQLVDGSEIVRILDQDAQASRFNNPEYAEDLFAGVELALASAWRDNSLRLVVLVGDASGYPPEHRLSSTKKDESVLRMAAQDRNIHIMALQLINPRHPEDRPIAERQFGELSRVRGGGDFESALVQIRTDQEQDFQQAVQSLSTYISDFLRQVGEQGAAVMDHLDSAPPSGQPPPYPQGAPGQATQAMKKVIQSAMVEYLGEDAKPPRDLVMWAADRDLTNPVFRALEIRVLLTREQLSDLTLALSRVLQAMQEAKLSNMDFFDSLQGLAAQSMKRPDALGRLDSLRQAGLVPRFIESLPYRSEVLALSRESYASLTAEQRATLQSRLTAKLSQYVKINETVDGWTTLNPQDAAGRQVYPLQLDYLP